jgi:hypothetical protein
VAEHSAHVAFLGVINLPGAAREITTMMLDVGRATGWFVSRVGTHLTAHEVIWAVALLTIRVEFEGDSPDDVRLL